MRDIDVLLIVLDGIADQVIVAKNSGTSEIKGKRKLNS